jgi:uncharacterized protein
MTMPAVRRAVPDGTQPVVLSLEFSVPLSHDAAFRRLVEDMGADATARYGAIGVDAVAAGRTASDERWAVTMRFEDEVALRRWRASDEAAHWRDRLEEVAAARPIVRIREGVEVWFDTTGPDAAGPPKWKMAILSVLGIYPAILLLDAALAPIRRQVPPWVGSLLVVCILSTLVTWVIMPTLTRLFRGWLYPDPPARRARDD